MGDGLLCSFHFGWAPTVMRRTGWKPPGTRKVPTATLHNHHGSLFLPASWLEEHANRLDLYPPISTTVLTEDCPSLCTRRPVLPLDIYDHELSWHLRNLSALTLISVIYCGVEGAKELTEPTPMVSRELGYRTAAVRSTAPLGDTQSLLSKADQKHVDDLQSKVRVHQAISFAKPT